MYTYKVMLLPNNKQKTKLKQTMNQCILASQIIYDYLDSFIKNKEPFPSQSDTRKWFTSFKKEHDRYLIKERFSLTKKEQRENHLDILFYDVSNDALKQAVKDTYNSFIRFFKKQAKYPVRKEFGHKNKSFYVDPYKIEFSSNKVRLEKIANNQKQNRQVLNWIKLAEKNRIPISEEIKYYNPRIRFDGNMFWLSVGVEDKYAPVKNQNKVSDVILGIDVNIKEIVTSEDKHYKNVTTDKKIKKQQRKIRLTQRKLSRKYIEERKKRQTKNYIKTKILLRKQYERLNHLKEAHLRNIVEDIFKRPPKTITIEDLDIKNMQKNKMISNKIQISAFRQFYNYLIDKANKYKIEVKRADKHYPSSKMCSCCNNIKTTLKLSERTYKCEKCGLKINRDYNAAINLARYR